MQHGEEEPDEKISLDQTVSISLNVNFFAKKMIFCNFKENNYEKE